MAAIKLPSDQEASGRSFGDEEIVALGEVIASGTLTATKGVQTRRLEGAIAELLGVEHVVALASGSAAIHTAVAALDVARGDEIITTSRPDLAAATEIATEASTEDDIASTTPGSIGAIRIPD